MIDVATDVFFGDRVGSGGFADVFEGTALSSDLRARAAGQQIAIKLLTSKFFKTFWATIFNSSEW